MEVIQLKKIFTILSVILLSLMLINTVVASVENKHSEPVVSTKVFARINQRVISYDEFKQIFTQAVRYKYYHGKVPQKELQRFQRQVGKDIVEQELVYQQARTIGLKPETKKIQAGFSEYNKKYLNNNEWKKQKEKNLLQLVQRLERQNLIEQMLYKVKDISKPDLESIKVYYKKYPEKFTEPKRIWLSLILLSVKPSSSEKIWQDAIKTANEFIGKIKQGDDFSLIAKNYSAHISAANGGDLGYLHQGMLEGAAQKAVQNLKKSELSQAVRVLEGISIFRINDIQHKKLKPFTSVKLRASELLYRNLQKQAWSKYLRKLKKTADIYLNEKLYTLLDNEIAKH
ncbi:hypothetical protein MNBD_GAMMA22-1951 [hydrothermal vent metagenome]|uniref:PpiC domain-containing protein n=1 Tax=hydrothermal vent metagenome TaxID=652676 RepID=A0A3B1A6P4_9ZZZZ